MHPHLLRIPLPWGGHFTIASYGFMIMCGFLLTLFLAQRRAKRLGLDPNAIFDVAIAMLIGGIVGARLFYVVYDWPTFRDNPLEVFRIDKGGLIFFGGAAGGIALLLAGLSRKNLPMRRSLDLIISLVPLAHAFGRIGCFLNGCCFGAVTRSWAGVRFPKVLDPGSQAVAGSPVFVSHVNRGLVADSAEWSLPVHPTQLYAVGYNLVIFTIVSYMLLRRRREGDVAWTYLGLYSVARFLNEFVRDDQAPVLLGLTIAQLICIPALVLSVVVLVRSRRRPPEPLPEPWQPPPA